MSAKIKLAIVGSRSLTNQKERLLKILTPNVKKIEYVITGGAKGIDTTAHDVCKELGIPVMIVYPVWYDSNGSYIKSAGFKRNYKIIDFCNKALILWDQKSTGTKHDISICEKIGKPYKLIICQPPVIEEKKKKNV